MSPSTATQDGEATRPGRRRGGAAFLLAQVGAHASSRFAERIADLGLTPPQAGLIRAIAAAPASSQQQLATQLGLLPSRVVAFVDDLESRGLLRRERSSVDRRQYALHLTQDGEALMRRLQHVARTHERDLCQALDEAEHAQLVALLGRIADQQGLTAGVHPGYAR
ncbi:MarR family winged helix-turn-helix transcriptional regulator [Micromonospora sp. NPDC006431]|uniref:MarR family winged helix-turn-helix transcriptional regulator n=1 Tax=Micromonospora sp. NPDC006431 TaxID=3364235 RepID=UPI0036982F4C